MRVHFSKGKTPYRNFLVSYIGSDYFESLLSGTESSALHASKSRSPIHDVAQNTYFLILFIFRFHIAHHLVRSSTDRRAGARQSASDVSRRTLALGGLCRRDRVALCRKADWPAGEAAAGEDQVRQQGFFRSCGVVEYGRVSHQDEGCGSRTLAPRLGASGSRKSR